MPENGAYLNLKEKLNNHVNSKRLFVSLEFFPPRNETELAKFWPVLERLQQGGPLFWDITWNTSRCLDNESPLSSISVASKAKNLFNQETVLHMTCTGSDDEENLLENLKAAKARGIKNILALRGDKVPVESGLSGEREPKLRYAVDMVRFIRQHFGDYFVIAVAGYPDGHPESTSYQDDLKYLKEKVDAGADFIITQLSFSFDSYRKFILDCQEIGITVPIIPGIFPIQTKTSLRNVSRLTQIEAPQFIKEAVELYSDDPKALREYGVDLAVDLCRKLIESELAPGLHFYSMNRDDSVIEILKRLGLWKSQSSIYDSHDLKSGNLIDQETNSNRIRGIDRVKEKPKNIINENILRL